MNKEERTEKIVEILHNLGFEPELLNEELGYRFEFEGLTVVLRHGDLNANCLTLFLPNIYQIADENRVEVMAALLQLANDIRYVQPTICGESAWLTYQHFLGENYEPTEELIEHMVRLLGGALVHFHKIIDNE